MVRGNTNSYDICTMLEEDFQNGDVAVARSHMQGSLAVVGYGQDVNGGDSEIRAGTHQ
jgi:hypothetical protein